MNEITENSGIKDKNMMLIYGYICMGIGLLVAMGGGIAGIGAYMVMPAAGIALMGVSMVLGFPILLVGLALAVLFRRSFQEKKQKKVTEYVTENMNRFRQMVPGWIISFNFIVNQRVYFVERRRKGRSMNTFGPKTYDKQISYYVQGQVIFTRDSGNGQPMMPN